MDNASNQFTVLPHLSFDLHGLDLHPSLRDYLPRRVLSKFGKFASRIEQITVRLDERVPHHGPVEKACRIRVALVGLSSVVVDYRDSDPRAAVDGALDHTERAVRRSLERHDAAPITRGRRDETRSPRSAARLAQG